MPSSSIFVMGPPTSLLILRALNLQALVALQQVRIDFLLFDLWRGLDSFLRVNVL